MAGQPHSAYYSADTDKVLWFVHASDTHIGTSGSTDTSNLQWLTGTARTVISPSFVVVSGDLTDSTNGNIFGYPNGPYQAEWDQYKSILSATGVDASSYFDIPGNHDAYNDKYFSYYLNNSVQGLAMKQTQASWIRSYSWGTYHFLGVNTAGNDGAPFSIASPYGDNAGLDSVELKFIGDELNAHADATLTLAFGHHPLVPTGSSTDTYLYYGKDEFVTLLNGHGASLYGYGHTHASSMQLFTQNMAEGIYYFNVSSLGKDSPNQYTVSAIDCNGISSVTQDVRTWPVVLVTAPVDRHLGGGVNPYGYTVPNGAANPVRALVFDPTGVTGVSFRVNGGAWQAMQNVSGNARLWQGRWNASALAEGEYTLEVQAITGSGVRSDSIVTYVKPDVSVAKVGATFAEIGKYVVSGSGKRKTTTFEKATSFKQGETVVMRWNVAASGIPVANATVQVAIAGPMSASVTSAASGTNGVAEAKWVTTAPGKRGQGGTAIGNYSGTVTNVTAAGYQWDGVAATTGFFSIDP